MMQDAPKEAKEEFRRNVRPVYLATMRPKRRKDVDVEDANFGVISEELLFNDDPSVRFANGEEVLAMDEDTGARKRARVLRDLGMGVFEVVFDHNGLKQATYATQMSRAPPKEAAAEVEVLDTQVTRVEDERGVTVKTTMTLRNAATKKEFEQTTTETRLKPKAAEAVAAPAAVRGGGGGGGAMEAKAAAEFGHVLEELLYGLLLRLFCDCCSNARPDSQTERDFAYRLEAVHTFYEKPIDVSNLLPPMARAVVFGNGTIAKLWALSRAVSDFPRDKSPGERIAAYRQYLLDSRSCYSDQIVSRSLGHVPLQGYLQSNAKFRKFACGQVKLVEDFLMSKKIATHGHLGSVLYGPVQRLPRVLLLVERMQKLNPGLPELGELLALVRLVLNEFEN